jgi:hypothetical protein
MLERLGLIGALAAAMGLLMFVACGEGGGDGVGASCTSDASCPSGEICHPDAKVCVKTCTAGTDCPDSAKNCAAISGTNTTKICKCTTDQLCAGGATMGSSAICSDLFDVCMTKCGSNTDCPSGTICQTSSGECGTTLGATCSTTDPQPAICSYGQYCTGTCQAVPPATCSNFTVSGHGTSWSATSSSGPIIYSLTQSGGFPNTLGGCNPGQSSARVHLRAYRTSSTFSTTDPQAVLNELHYVLENGTESSSKPYVVPSSYVLSNNNRNAEFDLGFCPPDTVGQFTAGLHFVDGNEACVTVQ